MKLNQKSSQMNAIKLKLKNSILNFSDFNQQKQLREENCKVNLIDGFQNLRNYQERSPENQSYGANSNIQKYKFNISKQLISSKKIKKQSLYVTSFKSKINYKNKSMTIKNPQINDGSYFKWKKNEIIDNHYELLESVGKGNFGQVFKAIDTEKNEMVAIKIIRSDQKYHQLAQQQINILNLLKLNQQSNGVIVKMKTHFKWKNHFCIVFELLSLNLLQFMQSINFQPLSLDTIRKITIQLLNALVCLKQSKIIHADIKLQNIVFKQNFKSGIKLIDFGTSMLNTEKYYDYIMSRYYRAPQIILGHQFDESIDMWSVGCVIVELYLGRILFPGQSEKQQLAFIIQCLGLPSNQYLNKCKRKNIYFSNDYQLLQTLTIRNNEIAPASHPFNEYITDKNFLNFIKKIFTWESKNRLNPYSALLQPWILQGIPADLMYEHKNRIKSGLFKTNGRRNSLVWNRQFAKNRKKSIDIQ